MVNAVRRETSVLSSEGRVVIPASIRKQLGLEPGVTLTFSAENGRVVMSTRQAAIAELQRMFAEARPEGAPLMSEQLIAERRAEAVREAEG
jgi:AbrB family looped-hinge helix DNA binding protein